MILNKPVVEDGSIINIDSREGTRIEPTREFFGKENTQVLQMDYADYKYVNPEGKEVGIEVKQVHTDLWSSLESQKLFKQVVDLVKHFDIHYLLIVGYPEPEIMKNMILKKKNPHHHWNMTLERWDGAYTSLQQLTQVVFAYNWEHALQRMNLLFKKSTDNKNRVYNYMEKFDNPAVTYLSGIKRIGLKTSELVCSELCLNNLYDLLCLDGDKLTSVDGIGDKTANKIMGALQ